MADIKDFFSNYLPKKLVENPQLCKDINAIYQFELGDAGTWSVDLTKEGGEVKEGPNAAPGCVVTCAAADFDQLITNPASGMMLFTLGKLKVTNVGLALSLQKLLS